MEFNWKLERCTTLEVPIVLQFVLNSFNVCCYNGILLLDHFTHLNYWGFNACCSDEFNWTREVVDPHNAFKCFNVWNLCWMGHSCEWSPCSWIDVNIKDPHIDVFFQASIVIVSSWYILEGRVFICTISTTALLAFHCHFNCFYMSSIVVKHFLAIWCVRNPVVSLHRGAAWKELVQHCGQRL